MSTSLDSFFRGIRYALDYSGYGDLFLKVKQINILEALLLGRNTIGVLPTGYGKSVIFHLLPFLFDHQKSVQNSIILVIAPLDALIEDQVESLKSRGIKAGVLKTAKLKFNNTVNIDKHSCDSDAEDECSQNLEHGITDQGEFQNIEHGDIRLLFTHPEAFISCKEGRKLLLSKVLQERVASCVIDEAHLVTEWGSEFRPDFRKLSQLGSLFPHAPILALTATAPPLHIRELIEAIVLYDPLVFVGNLDRPNIFIEKEKRKPKALGEESYDVLNPIAENLKIQLTKYPLTIIYLPLKWCGYAFKYFLEILGEKSYLHEKGRKPENCLFAQYHASQTESMKQEIMSQLSGKSEKRNIRVVFATIAIGLGVNIPDVRHIIHVGVPRTLEAYYQEIGRAGRDGKPATASLYYNGSDIASNVKGLMPSMREFCLLTDKCLRKTLINYLGSDIAFTGLPHSCCSNCSKACSCFDCSDALLMSSMEINSDSPTQATQVRAVSERQRMQIFQMLKKYRLELGAQRRRFGTIDTTTGFTLKLITSIVERCEQISSVDDLCQTFPIWEESHAQVVMQVISKVCGE